MKKTVLLKLVLLISVVILLYGCASSIKETKEISVANEPPVITGIRLQDNGLEISSNRHFVYTMYTANDPYKISLDIPDMRQGSFTNKIVSDKAGISEVVVRQTDSVPPSLKIDVMLQTPSAVSALYKDNTLLLILKPAEPVALTGSQSSTKETTGVAVTTSKETLPASEEKRPSAVEDKKPDIKQQEISTAPLPPATEIASIDLRKSADVLKIVVKGNGAMTPNVFPIDERIVVDIPGVVLKTAVPAEVISPLKGIRAGRHKDKIRLVLDLKEKTTFDVAAAGDYIEVSLKRKDTGEADIAQKAVSVAAKEPAFAVEMLMDEPPAKETPTSDTTTSTSPAPETKYTGKKISLDFQDSEAAPIFRLLADVVGYNLVLDPAVKGKITLKLMNVPWDQALEIVLNQTHLNHRIEGNILWIAPASVFDALVNERAKTKETEEKAEELVQEIVRVNYASADAISSAITTGKLLSQRGSITIDSRMNTLIIKDTQKSIDKIKELMKIMDVAKPQVMIEAKIVEVGNNYSNALGISWGGSVASQTWPNTFGGNFSVNTPTFTAGPGATSPGGALNLNIGRANAINVSLSLSALESIGKSKTLSNPKILTMDNEPATIQQGRTFFIETVSQAGTQTQQQSATLSLNVTPKITPDGFVQLKVTATDNSLESVSPPVVNTKSLNTQALVKNGETLVLGGIYTTDVTEGEKDVPFLSKVPGLGWLFKTKSQSGPNVKELLIFITPVIMPQQ